MQCETQLRVWPLRALASSRAATARLAATVTSDCTLALAIPASRLNSGELASASGVAVTGCTHSLSFALSRRSVGDSCSFFLSETENPGTSAAVRLTARASAWARASSELEAPWEPFDVEADGFALPHPPSRAATASSARDGGTRDIRGSLSQGRNLGPGASYGIRAARTLRSNGGREPPPLLAELPPAERRAPCGAAAETADQARCSGRTGTNLFRRECVTRAPPTGLQPARRPDTQGGTDAPHRPNLPHHLWLRVPRGRRRELGARVHVPARAAPGARRVRDERPPRREPGDRVQPRRRRHAHTGGRLRHGWPRGQLEGSVVDHTASQVGWRSTAPTGFCSAVNPGSDSLSVFSVAGDALLAAPGFRRAAPSRSACTESEGYVYVLNAGQGGSIRGFVLAGGTLGIPTPAPGAPCRSPRPRQGAANSSPTRRPRSGSRPTAPGS